MDIAMNDETMAHVERGIKEALKPKPREPEFVSRPLEVTRSNNIAPQPAPTTLVHWLQLLAHKQDETNAKLDETNVRLDRIERFLGGK
jgi:hypothetical protein